MLLILISHHKAKPRILCIAIALFFKIIHYWRIHFKLHVVQIVVHHSFRQFEVFSQTFRTSRLLDVYQIVYPDDNSNVHSDVKPVQVAILTLCTAIIFQCFVISLQTYISFLEFFYGIPHFAEILAKKIIFTENIHYGKLFRHQQKLVEC